MQNPHNKKDTLQCLSLKSVLYFLDIFVANVLQMRCELNKFHRFSPHLTTPQTPVKQGFERNSKFRRLSLGELYEREGNMPFGIFPASNCEPLRRTVPQFRGIRKDSPIA